MQRHHITDYKYRKEGEKRGREGRDGGMMGVEKVEKYRKIPTVFRGGVEVE